MSETHHLKTWPIPYGAVQDGVKTFEVRKDDRFFQSGDVVHLHYYNPTSGIEADEALTFTVGWVLRGGQFGLEPGHVAFSLLPFKDEE